MRERTIFNTTATALGIFSFLGAFGCGVLYALGFVDQAESLASAMKLIGGVQVSWPGIYLLLFILSICFLIVFNWNIIVTTVYILTISRKRDWNMAGPQIVTYIKDASYFGASLEHERMYELAVGALQEAAREGRLKLAGRKAGATKITKITRKECKSLIFSIEGRRVGGVLRVPQALLVRNQYNPEDQYLAIYADKDEVESIWPRRGS